MKVRHAAITFFMYTGKDNGTKIKKCLCKAPKQFRNVFVESGCANVLSCICRSRDAV